MDIGIKIDNHVDKANIEFLVANIITLFESGRINGVSQRNVGVALKMISKSVTQAPISMNHCSVINNAPPTEYDGQKYDPDTLL